jgi:hypothetical protein
MSKQILIVILGAFLVAGPAIADPQAKPAKHDPEWTDHNESDPGVASVKKTATLQVADGSQTTESVVPELAKIVVLCATEEEEKFKQEWSKYVSDHDLKGAELKKTIREVSNQAEAYRAREMALTENREKEDTWKAERRRFMNEVARKALNPAR